MLMEGLIIMIVGMAIVFLFLSIIIAIMYGVRFFINFILSRKKDLSSTIAGSQNFTPEEMAVAVAAIRKSMKK